MLSENQRLYEVQKAVKKIMAKAQANNNHIEAADPLVRDAEELARHHGFRLVVSTNGFPQLYQYGNVLTLQMFDAKEEEHPAMVWAYRYGENMAAKLIEEVKRLVSSGGVGVETDVNSILAVALLNMADGLAGRTEKSKREMKNLRKL